MNIQTHEQLKSHIWEIANRLRGPYRPPQYRLVMLPMVVLRRLDCVLEPTKDAVLKEHAKLTAQSTPENAMDRLLGRAADPNRKHPLYNISPFTFRRLLGDAEHIAPNLVSYINGFSPTARSIFERFKFGDQIEKLDSSNRLFTIVKAMADVDLHPDRIDNMQMVECAPGIGQIGGPGIDRDIRFAGHCLSLQRPPALGNERRRAGIGGPREFCGLAPARG